MKPSGTVLLLLVSLAASLVSGPAEACRPFGSYDFAEDRSGGIWFTEGDNNAVSRLAPDGSVRTFPLPTPNAEPISLALDRRGNLWFVESGSARIGRLGRDGKIVEFPPTDGHPIDIQVDRKGEAWFTQMGRHQAGAGQDGGHAGHGSHGGSKVGRILANGSMKDYPVAEGWPSGLAIDRRDRVWVSTLVPSANPEEKTASRGKLAQLGRDGRWRVVFERERSCPMNLTPAPDGSLWFSDRCRGTIERQRANGSLEIFRPHPDTFAQKMSLAPDGTLWFADSGHNKLGRITPKGRIEYVDRPDETDAPFAVLATRRGDLVFSEYYNYNLNRLTRSGVFEEHLVQLDSRHDARQVQEGEVCYVKFTAAIADKREMDRRRAEEVRAGKFKPAPDGADKLAEARCLGCHDARRLILSRRSDWSPSIGRMQEYMQIRNAAPLTAEEKQTLVRYFNTNYSFGR
jgi:virginiamycin B lyase